MSRAHVDNRRSPPGQRTLALGLPAPRPPETRALASLRPYSPRWVWPPSFEGTHEWRVLREDIATNGIRTPLRILRNGWVIDGTHRYRIAQVLGLERVTVQVVPVPLGSSADDPLRASRPAPDRADRRARGPGTAAPDATPSATCCSSPWRKPRNPRSARRRRAARRLANLRRRPGSEEPPTGPTIDAVAHPYGLPACRLKRLLTLAPPRRRRGPGRDSSQETIRSGTPTRRQSAPTATRRRSSRWPGTPRA